MILKAKKNSDGTLVLPTEADAGAEKGAYLCPYCEIPLVPVDGKFWRLYPGDEHQLSYCKAMALKERIHIPGMNKEFKFFMDEHRPEREYRKSGDDIFGEIKAEEDPVDVDNNSANDLGTGGTGKAQLRFVRSEGEHKFNPEAALTKMAQLYDECFYSAPPDTPMFAGTKSDYMVLPNNISTFLRDNGNTIKGFKILGVAFSGYSRRDRTLCFDIYENVWEGSNKYPSSVLKARAEMFCIDEDYFNDILLQKYFTNKDRDGKYTYKYRKVILWVKGNWKWTPASDCSTCIYRKIHKDVDCGNCLGLAKARINTSTSLLFIRWQTHDRKWGKRLTAIDKEAKKNKEFKNDASAEVEKELAYGDSTK